MDWGLWDSGKALPAHSTHSTRLPDGDSRGLELLALVSVCPGGTGWTCCGGGGKPLSVQSAGGHLRKCGVNRSSSGGSWENTLLRLGCVEWCARVWWEGPLGWCGLSLPRPGPALHPLHQDVQVPAERQRPVIKGPGSTLAKLGTEWLVLGRPGPSSGCRPLGASAVGLAEVARGPDL